MASKHTGWGLISTQAKLLDLPLLVQFLPLYNGTIGKVVGRESDKSSKDDLYCFCLFPAYSLRTTSDYHQPNYACLGLSRLTVPGTAPCLLSPDAPDELPLVVGGWPQPHIGSRAAAGPMAG